MKTNDQIIDRVERRCKIAIFLNKQMEHLDQLAPSDYTQRVQHIHQVIVDWLTDNDHSTQQDLNTLNIEYKPATISITQDEAPKQKQEQEAAVIEKPATTEEEKPRVDKPVAVETRPKPDFTAMLKPKHKEPVC